MNFRKYVLEEEPVDAIQKIVDFDLCFESWVGVKVLDNTNDEEFLNLVDSVIDISQWLKIYKQSEPRGNVEQFTFNVIRKYERISMSFGEKLKFCRHTRCKNPRHFRKVIDSLIKETADVDGLIEIYLSDFGEYINKRVLRKIRRTETIYDKWCAIRDSCKTSEKAPLKEVAIEKANKTSKA